MIFLYIPAKENLYSPDIGDYVSFGIRALRLTERGWTEAAFVADVSTKISFVFSLIELCIKKQLDPMHLFDFIQDSI